MHLLPFVTQSALYFYHVTHNIKQILFQTRLPLGHCGVFGFWECRAMKFWSDKIDRCVSSLWFTAVGSASPEPCSLPGEQGWMLLLECPVRIIHHSTLWKNSGEACRNPSGWRLALGKCFSRKFLERQWIFEARHLWFEFCTPAPHHHAQACMNIGFSNIHHHQRFLSWESG